MKNSKTVLIAAVVCCLAVVAMVLALCLPREGEEAWQFVPPEFDKNASVGVPKVDDASWMPIYKDGMGFSAHVCGNVVVNNKSADIYFTNDQGNKVWMKLRITDANGKIICETGLIKAGEYIKSVSFNTVPKIGTKISMKIMTYEPETYYSTGAVSLNTVIGG